MAHVDLITTPGAADANSYGTLEEADAYFESRLNSASWTALTDDAKEHLLISATLYIDNIRFVGDKYKQYSVGHAEYQRLQWPRVPPNCDEYMLGIAHLMKYDGREEWVNNAGNPIIPEKLKFAQFEQALYLLVNQKLIEARIAIQKTGVISARTGNVEEKYKNSNNSSYMTSSEAIQFLLFLKCIDDSFRVWRA